MANTTINTQVLVNEAFKQEVSNVMNTIVSMGKGEFRRLATTANTAICDADTVELLGICKLANGKIGALEKYPGYYDICMLTMEDGIFHIIGEGSISGTVTPWNMDMSTKEGIDAFNDTLTINSCKIVSVLWLDKLDMDLAKAIVRCEYPGLATDNAIEEFKNSLSSDDFNLLINYMIVGSHIRLNMERIRKEEVNMENKRKAKKQAKKRKRQNDVKDKIIALVIAVFCIGVLLGSCDKTEPQQECVWGECHCFEGYDVFGKWHNDNPYGPYDYHCITHGDGHDCYDDGIN